MTSRRRFLPRVLAACLAAATLLSGCQGEVETYGLDDVEIKGKLGTAPMVTFPTPLTVTASETRVLEEGDGRERTSGEPLVVVVSAFNGNTGEYISGREGGRPRIVFMTEEYLGEELTESLNNVREGSRIVASQPVDDESGQQYMAITVIDVLHSRAHGDAVTAPDDVPGVVLDSNGAPSIDLDPENLPTSLRIIPLIRGDGPQVAIGDQLILNYSAWTWSDGVLFDSTWVGKIDSQEGTEFDPSVGVDTGQAVPSYVDLTDTFTGLRDGLVDQHVGSQVMLLIPPAESIGTDGLIMVVDILAASSPQEGSE